MANYESERVSGLDAGWMDVIVEPDPELTAPPNDVHPSVHANLSTDDIILAAHRVAEEAGPTFTQKQNQLATMQLAISLILNERNGQGAAAVIKINELRTALWKAACAVTAPETNTPTVGS